MDGRCSSPPEISVELYAEPEAASLVAFVALVLRDFEIAVMLSLLVLFKRDEVHLKGLKWQVASNGRSKI
jgi:hypothetical protein